MLRSGREAASRTPARGRATIIAKLDVLLLSASAIGGGVWLNGARRSNKPLARWRQKRRRLAGLSSRGGSIAAARPLCVHLEKRE